MVDLLCYLVAVILFLLAAFNVSAKPQLLPLGLAFAFAPLLIHAAQALN